MKHEHSYLRHSPTKRAKCECGKQERIVDYNKHLKWLKQYYPKEKKRWNLFRINSIKKEVGQM